MEPDRVGGSQTTFQGAGPERRVLCEKGEGISEEPLCADRKRLVSAPCQQ